MKSIHDKPHVDLDAFHEGVRTWKPYFPKGYPIRDEHHNPWVVADVYSGKSAYTIWQENPGISEEDFRAILDGFRP